MLGNELQALNKVSLHNKQRLCCCSCNFQMPQTNVNGDVFPAHCSHNFNMNFHYKSGGKKAALLIDSVQAVSPDLGD